MSKIKNITIGCDPELFLEKNNSIVSAEGMIGGTKENPKLISEEGHAVQEDNIMVEFNIPPSSTKNDFKNNILFTLSYLETLASINGCKLNISASAVVDSKYLQTQQAKTFGCESDWDAYVREENSFSSKNKNLRSCGGHIHVGYLNPDQETSEKIVFAMDAVLGLESISLDSDDRRRSMYGKAGCFRFKNYGLEYRTLSNFWIKTPELMEWAYTKTMEAIELVNSGAIDIILDLYKFNIRNIINNNNKEEALLILSEIKKIKNTKKVK
jgi:hypothetical protein